MASLIPITKLVSLSRDPTVTGPGERDNRGARFTIVVLFLSPPYSLSFVTTKDGHDGHVIPIYLAPTFSPDQLCLLCMCLGTFRIIEAFSHFLWHIPYIPQHPYSRLLLQNYKS